MTFGRSSAKAMRAAEVAANRVRNRFIQQGWKSKTEVILGGIPEGKAIFWLREKCLKLAIVRISLMNAPKSVYYPRKSITYENARQLLSPLFIPPLCCIRRVRTLVFTIEETPWGVAIKHNGELVTNYIFDQANKPYMWPLVGPTESP